MKKEIIKVLVCICVFMISVFVVDAVLNRGNSDMTAEMRDAKYPIISMEIDNQEINSLHGYSQKMEESYQNETMVCIDDERTLDLVIDRFGAAVQGLSFEVRSVDGERLVESTSIYNYISEDDRIYAQINIKDLIEPEIEYALVILINLESGETIRYYTRVIHAPQYPQKKMIAFAANFHKKIFNKEEAEELATYLESNEEGDNTTYNKVNIHSSFSQITWGDLKIRKEGEAEIYLRQIDKDLGVVEISYFVSEPIGKDTVYYKVKEYYRMRLGSERMYLLDYERTMDQIFNPDDFKISSNKINLGITNSYIGLKESEGGKVFAFVQGDRLFSYNVTDNKIASIFSFYNNENWDKRTLYDAHDIEILNIDETGNVRFLVYGYMNRGAHEGGLGIQVYYYNSMSNTIEEEIYIPNTSNYSILKENVKNLVYVSNTNYLYLMLDGILYSVDLMQKTYDVVARDLKKESYHVSESNRMVVWESDNDSLGAATLTLMDLNNKKTSVIEAGNENYIKPLGFMGEDLIYGIAHKQDAVQEASGNVVLPMYSIKIQLENDKQLNSYEKSGYYVTDVSVVENQIHLKRVMKSEEMNKFISAPDDQIMNSEILSEGTNTVEVVPIDNYGKIVQISVNSTLSSKNLKVLTPREVLYEGERELVLKEVENIERYYVYEPNGKLHILENSAAAVKMASEVSGIVRNDRGDYVWKKTIRSTKNQIMKIKEASVTEEKNSIAVCLDTMLQAEGVLKNTETLLNRGDNVMQILSDNLTEYQVIDLSGCSLDTILYYVNQDLPVMALLNDKTAVLIIGFNELNTVIMNPETGTIDKKGMQDSAAWFEQNENRFVTYIKSNH